MSLTLADRPLVRFNLWELFRIKMVFNQVKLKNYDNEFSADRLKEYFQEKGIFFFKYYRFNHWYELLPAHISLCFV